MQESVKKMNNLKAISALKDLKMYASSRSLDAINYAIMVLEKLEETDIVNPLESLNSKEK